MFRKNQQPTLSSQVAFVCNLIQQQQVASKDIQEALQDMLQAASRATRSEHEQAITQLAQTIETQDVIRSAFLAIGCGALIEQGAPPEPAAQAIVAKTREACLLLSPKDERNQAVCKMLTNATLAIAMRMPSVRQQLKKDADFVSACERQREQNSGADCLLQLFQVLENERILVFHPASGKGYRIIINGIGKNFELHTLLADAVLGDPAQGRIPGERPDPRVVEATKDGPIPFDSDDHFPSMHSHLNLWNWTALRLDGTLPIEQKDIFAERKHFIWNEGIPADIISYEGQRIILVSEVPFSRSWNAGRFFPGLSGQLEIVEELTPQAVQDWLRRLADAAANAN